MKDIILPAFDTPSADMTPFVLAAMKDGAKVTPHPDDASKIVVTFTDDKSAKKFQTSVAPFLPIEEPEVVAEPEATPTVEAEPETK